MRSLWFALAFVLLALCPQPPAAADEAAAVLGVGAVVQDFGLRSIDPISGALKTVHWLSDYVGAKATNPKRVLVLSFYATWCKACVAEMPALQRVQNQYGSQGLQILGINVRSKNEDVIAALRLSHELMTDKAVRYPLLFDRYTQRNQALYLGDAALLPCNLVIDHNGKIIARFQGGAQAEGLAALETAIKAQLDIAASLQPSPAPGMLR